MTTCTQPTNINYKRTVNGLPWAWVLNIAHDHAINLNKRGLWRFGTCSVHWCVMPAAQPGAPCAACAESHAIQLRLLAERGE